MADTTGNTRALWAGAPLLGMAQIPTTAISVNSQAPGTIGTNCTLLYSVPASPADGAYLQKIRLSFTSTTGTVSIVATNINVFFSTVSSGATSSADTFLQATYSIPALTISAVTTAPTFFEVPLLLPCPASRHVLISQTVAAATSSAWVASLYGGTY